MKISVILPTYNEKGNILQLIQSIQSYLIANKRRYEIIIVDDDSPDNTSKLVRRKTDNKTIKLFVRKNIRGLASAIKYGIDKSTGDLIIVMDTDFNHDPALIPVMISNIKQYNCIIGSRFIKNGGMENMIRYICSYIFNIYFIKPILNSPTNENLSGYFCIRKKDLLKLPADNIFYGYGDYFFRLIYYGNNLGYTYKEIPSYYKERKYGNSKSKFTSMLFTYIFEVLKCRFR